MKRKRKSEREATPPYVSFATLRNFIDRFRDIGVPNRIDRSVMTNLSGGVQSQMGAALRYLGLVNAQRAPTDKLVRITSGEDEERQQAFQEVLKSAYPFIFQDGLNLETATGQQIHERFVKAGASGETVRKCITFFLGAAKDAGLAISPHIQTTKTFGGTKPGTQGPRKKRRVTKKLLRAESGGDPGSDLPIGEGTWKRMLLDKFPEFDPAWPDEAKSEWLKGFNELMNMTKEN